MEAELTGPPAVGHPAGASLCNWLGAAHSRILGSTKSKLETEEPEPIRAKVLSDIE